MTLKKLQNGSDIRGISLTGIQGEDPNFTPVEADLLAKGFLTWLSKKTKKDPSTLKVSIGRDPRLSGKLLRQATINALGSYGVEILDAGLASTPAMFMSTIFDEYKCDGAIMLTASHLPFNRNGFKFFWAQGGLDKGDISEIIQYAEGDFSYLGEESHSHLAYKENGLATTLPYREIDLMDRYSSHLRDIIIKGVNQGEKPLQGLKILVNAGNGSGGFYATKVLAPLGADITDSQYLEPDGTFPNHPPNPENKEAMSAISMAVLSKGADLGIIFDTDVDRSAAVDHCGREISRDGIVALAATLVRDSHPGSTVVTDSITSNQLTAFLESNLGLTHLRYMRGYKNVINKAKEIDNAWLAIETSGHAAFRDNYFLDDGAYLATLIVTKTALLAKEGKKLSTLLEDLEHPVEASEIRMKIQGEDFSAYGDQVLEKLESWVLANPDQMTLVTPNYEGVRIDFPQGWCLLRKSLHDPIMPLNIAADKVGGVKEISAKLKEFLDTFTRLDSSKVGGM